MLLFLYVVKQVKPETNSKVMIHPYSECSLSHLLECPPGGRWIFGRFLFHPSGLAYFPLRTTKNLKKHCYIFTVTLFKNVSGQSRKF